MLNSTRHVAAAACVTLIAGSIGLSGCSTGSNMTVTHNPPLSTFGGRSTARSAVQTAILVASTSTGIAVPGGASPAAIARQVLDMMRGRRIAAVTGGSTGACTSGSKTSQVTNSDGSATRTIDLYYDAACATLESEQIIKIVTPGSTVTPASGTLTTYDTSGNVTSHHQFSATATNATGTQTVNISDAAATTVGGTAIAAYGATCVGATNSATMTCSVAQYGTVGTTFGQTLSTSGTAAATPGGNNTVSVGVNYYGAGISGIAQSGANWVITGTGAFNSASGSYTYTSTGATGAGTLSLADGLYTYTITATLSATGLAVTIVRGTDPIATATVDRAGDGTISYADGTSDVIAGGLVGV